MPTRSAAAKKAQARQERWLRYWPAYLMLGLALLMMLPGLLGAGAQLAGNAIGVAGRWLDAAGRPIAPLFTQQVQYWRHDIARWSAEHELDPNLLATVMQIESCGHPSVTSVAGAQGLFQVMPFHFEDGEDWLQPDTNALRGASFLRECAGYANGDIGLTLACYNGGPGVTVRAMSLWPHETRRYAYWGQGIYEDAANHQAHSERLDEWLHAGGVYLCSQASSAIASR